jgi:hypothetical protein
MGDRLTPCSVGVAEVFEAAAHSKRLPGEQSARSGMPLERLAALLHRQLEGLGVDRPVLVGRSMRGPGDARRRRAFAAAQ